MAKNTMVVVNNRDKIECRKGMTVQDVLNEMGYVYRRITVTVNGRLVQQEDYETCMIPENADVNVFHLGHGG